MLNPKDITVGQEQWEFFNNRVGGRTKQYCQYDFRTSDAKYGIREIGELFSCVKPTLDECRKARDAWLYGNVGESRLVPSEHAP
ncbi:MAG: DUF3873 domain-containing protein [Oscillospiraceae bacterium]|jgi:hypothetical protein|nr:DUF3873 domain-containing protein [Oscillospiraceae bacterium]